MAEQLPDHVYGVIVELEGDNLILPNSAVVEVLGQDALTAQSAGPDWLLGEVVYELDKLPVISLEAFWGEAVPEMVKRSRVVVLKAPDHDDRIAILVRSYPLIVTLNEVAVQVNEDAEPRDKVLASVRVANRLALIPDLDALAKAAHEAA